MKKIICLLMLVLFAGIAHARIDAIQEQNNPVTYAEGNITYTIDAVYISNGRVRFTVNNESSELLSRLGTHSFSDRSSIFVREILEEEAKEGPDMVSFRFWPGRCETIYCRFAEQEEAPEIIEGPEQEPVQEPIPEIIEEPEQETPEEAEEEPAQETQEIFPHRCSFEKLVLWIAGWFK